MKTLKDFMEVYKPKAPDEQKFVDKHVTIKFKDRNEVGGKENGDDVFNASNIKPVKRKDNRQGYDVGEDEKVYEETDIEESLGMGYKPTSEKSKFDDGHRAKLLNPDGKLSYLSQKSYATPAHAKAAAKYYHSIGHLPSQTIDSKMRQYNKDYDTKKESVEADEINDLLDEALAILEKTLTPAELKKREEIAKAIGRGNPKMPMPQKMAIATAQAKKVAEEVEAIDELSKNAMLKYLSANKKSASGGMGDKEATKRMRGADMATRKYTARGNKYVRVPATEEVDYIDEAKVRHYVVAKGQKGWFVNQHTGPYASDVWHHSVQTGYHDTKGAAVAWAKKHAGDQEHKIDIKEEVEDLDEGLMHNRYMRSHGKNARGTGAWAFTTKEYGSPKENEMHFTSGQKSLSDAHKEAAAKLGTKNLYVMEEVELIDETAKIVAHLQKRYGDNIRKSHVVSAANDFGVDASKLAKAVRAKLGKNMLGEENDDGWYTHNEMHGKVSKENWKKGWRYNNLKDKPFYHQPTKTWHASIKEEVEQVDEISADMADRYLKGKRERDYKRSDDGTYSIPRKPQSIRRKNIDAKGTSLALKTIQRPRNRLTKEDIIDRAVGKYVPEELKFTPEERMIKRLEGLREGHIDMLMSLFESLNDVNQSKMIESAETEEGLNQLLDFAINNRGA